MVTTAFVMIVTTKDRPARVGESVPMRGGSHPTVGVQRKFRELLT